MNLEGYLIEETYYILAINEISKKVDCYIKENFYDLIKGRVDKNTIEKIIALNGAIQMITFAMRQRKKRIL
ncbi:hypothetical protein IJ843_04560 [bacterium]|nr:hypothetical protein [bacterium]